MEDSLEAMKFFILSITWEMIKIPTNMMTVPIKV